MTREEVIARLKEIDIRDALQEDYDALYVAIEALEQKPCDYYDADNKTCRRSEVPKEPCEDAISRQAVDDAIYDYSRSCDVNYQQIMEFIEKIPSVTPQQKIGHWIFKNDNVAIPTGYFQCSECNSGKLLHVDNYCPSCGVQLIPFEQAESEEEEWME